jgi:hypothetical protein
MEFFGTVESIEQLKSEYLNYLNKWKGSDIMLDVKKQYDSLLEKFGVELNKQIDEENKSLPATEQKRHYDCRNDKFAETLDKIINFNMSIEIIGQWIWCFDSYEYREQLKELGFWYSTSKKAWVFNGHSKRNLKTKNKINDIRKKYGSEIVKSKEEGEE